jgi:hypothetical protein
MNNGTLPSTLSDISTARLPVAYEAAAKAISECERIDECKSWSDRAAALASYARQAKDDTLRVMAVRIQARAERRCGELLKQIPSATGAHLKQEGALPLSRTAAAEAAGLSEHRRKTALRMASVPAEDFEQHVESSAPPTVTKLAEQGKQSRVLEPAPAPARFKATCAALSSFATFCDANDAAEAARAFNADDIAMARKCVATLDQWLDRFVANLTERKPTNGSAAEQIGL